jgi:hypothetical protein
MKGYRKPSGIYLELSDATPVSETLTPVALRPSLNHIFADAWATNPLDAGTCWRVKTTVESHADRDAELQALLDSAAGKALKAIALVGIDKGHWTLAELRTKYRTL